MPPRRAAGSGGTPTAKRQRRQSVEAEEEVAEADAWSYDRLWDAPDISKGWHSRNVRFWRSQGADVRGATGGGVSQRDLQFSREAVAKLATAYCGEAGRFERALDLGAGIGRVTEAVLRRHCAHVDLVEFVQKHLKRARETLGTEKAGCTFSFHGSAVQKHEVPRGHYSFIWCQWLLMYLTDADALDLLRRLGPGLARGGLLVVKENVSTSDKATYFDDAEGELWEEGDQGGPVSCVRTEMHYEDLFERAGLVIKEQTMQRDSSGKTMDMMLYVLAQA